MKRQFVQMTPSSGNSQSAVEAPGLPVDAQTHETPPQMPYHPEKKAKGTGLLSNYGSGIDHSQSQQGSQFLSNGSVDPSVGRATDPVLDRGARNIMPDQVSPHQSAIGPMQFPSRQGGPQAPNTPPQSALPPAWAPPATPANNALYTEPPRAAVPPAWAPPAAPASGALHTEPPRAAVPPAWAPPAAPASGTLHTEPPRPAVPPAWAPPAAPANSPALPPAWAASAAPAMPRSPAAQPPLVLSAPSTAPWAPQARPMPRPGVQQQQGNRPPWNPPQSAKSKKSGKKKGFPTWARAVIAVATVLLLIVGGLTVYYEVNYASSVSSITGHTATTFQTTNKAGDGASQSAANTSTGNILSGQRVNILLLGSDNDSKFQGTILAQTDIILTIDPQTKYVGMLSIPRDMQVTVPGASPHKLDEVFSLGFQTGRTNDPYADAAGLTIATIEQNFGIPINHYAWVGLSGFIKVIDTAGGVDVDATHPMVDDVYPDDGAGSKATYGYRRLYIAPGPQHMNGEQALLYVRTRHSDLVGDFGRSARQQQVLSQLKVKLSKPDIINELPQLLKDMNGYVKTDMQLNDLVGMANYARSVDLNKVDRKVLSAPYSANIPGTTNYTPVCSQVIPLISQMFGLGDKANCITQTNVNPTTTSSSNNNGKNTNGNNTNGNNTNGKNGGKKGKTGSIDTTQPVASTDVLPNSLTNASNTVQSLGQVAQVSAMNLSQGNSDLLGVHSILDMMFMVTFESFDAERV